MPFFHKSLIVSVVIVSMALGQQSIIYHTQETSTYLMDKNQGLSTFWDKQFISDETNEVFDQLHETNNQAWAHSYIATSDNEYPAGVEVDTSGNIVVAGTTTSSDFQTLNAYQESSGGGIDVFVAKFTPNGQLIFATYLGGSGDDHSRGIALDASNNIYVSGFTTSTDFPTSLDAYQTNNAGGDLDGDAFIAKFTPDGQTLLFATYLGGNGNEHLGGMSLDAVNNIVVTGRTDSTNFPTVNALQSSRDGINDAFVAKLSANGQSLVFSTYLGGSNEETGVGVDTEITGNAVISGITSSNNFPTSVNSFQTSYGGGEDDAFVVKLNADGTLLWSTYLGGSGADRGTESDFDTTGDVVVTGFTASTNLPTTVDAFQTTYRGGAYDAFVAKLSANGQSLIFNTYLGGNDFEIGSGLAINATDSIVVTGRTSSNNFLTQNAYQGTHANPTSNDFFVTKLSPDGQSVIFSTYLGGTGNDNGWSIDIDTDDNVIFLGWTSSSNFPTVNAYQESKGDDEDIVVAKFTGNGQSPVFITYFGDISGTTSTETTSTTTNSTENTTPSPGFEFFVVVFGMLIIVSIARKKKYKSLK